MKRFTIVRKFKILLAEYNGNLYFIRNFDISKMNEGDEIHGDLIQQNKRRTHNSHSEIKNKSVFVRFVNGVHFAGKIKHFVR